MLNYYTMKIFILLLFISINLIGQTINYDSLKIAHDLDSLGIKLNQPDVPTGYIMYYDCDSLAFFKKTSGDTIIFLTPGSETPMSYSGEHSVMSFPSYLATRRNFPPSFPNIFLSDGRINIIHYSPTLFVYRRDSLFIQEVVDDKFAGKMFKLIEKYVNGKIDSLTMTSNIAKTREKYKPVKIMCYIFNKNMFNSSNIYNIEHPANPTYAKVTLENKWTKNDVNYYAILLEGDYKGTPTAVRYTFDENMKFLKWEGCEK